jgi:hypothetical protein
VAGRGAAVGVDFTGELASRNDYVLVGADQYNRTDLGTPGPWTHIDRTRVTDPQSLKPDLTSPDPIGVGALLDRVQSTTGDAHRVAGTLRAGTGGQFKVPAGCVPYTATLDDQGRLTELSVDKKWTVRLSGYGVQAAPAAPAAPITEAPESYYQRLNG